MKPISQALADLAGHFTTPEDSHAALIRHIIRQPTVKKKGKRALGTGKMYSIPGHVRYRTYGPRRGRVTIWRGDRNKYTGAALRKLARERGVGRPPA